ncbi:MAG TPA: DUF1345 domain-containing protein, partial [Flavisolibacter sp.]|nr:DUF1345 domain-containing protein [Flavisolibacter sp.]
MQRIIPYIDRIARGYRVAVSLIVAVLSFVLVFRNHSLTIAALSWWIVFSAFLLLFSWATILARHPKDTAIIASEQDEGYWLLFIIILTASIFSLFGILYLLHRVPTVSRESARMQLLLSIIALFTSWILIHTLFTIKYADMYYRTVAEGKDPVQGNGGLSFPGAQSPDFLDFAYYSFTIGMTYQTSDVNTTTQRARRLTLLHSLISFIY